MLETLTLAAALTACGALEPQPAGGDYLNPADRIKLGVVEAYHFTPDVEALRRGASDTVARDLAYTLEHFPNHHRALAAMARLGLRSKSVQPPGARYSVDCYFDRAMRFNAHDAQLRGIYAGYLLAAGRDAEALAQLEQAVAANPADDTAQYNLGLLYLRRKDYASARAHAKAAYAAGFPLPGLKQKLSAAGQWDQP